MRRPATPGRPRQDRAHAPRFGFESIAVILRAEYFGFLMISRDTQSQRAPAGPRPPAPWRLQHPSLKAFCQNRRAHHADNAVDPNKTPIPYFLNFTFPFNLNLNP